MFSSPSWPAASTNYDQTVRKIVNNTNDIMYGNILVTFLWQYFTHNYQQQTWIGSSLDVSTVFYVRPLYILQPLQLAQQLISAKITKVDLPCKK